MNEDHPQNEIHPAQPEPIDPRHEPEVARDEGAFASVPYTPDSPGETVRKTGMAYSAGIVFFGSVVFCLLLGWIADWLLGTRPWGIVAGIVLGSIIGFIQFFRISSRIFKNHDDGPQEHPLLNNRDDFDK